MAVAHRASAVPTGNPTTGFTVTVPASVAADDLLFLALTSRDSTGAGSLAVTDNDTGGNSWAKIQNSTDHKATLWYKRATSGTASKTVTVAGAVGSASGVLSAFSGASTDATPYTNLSIETNASADETHAEFTPTNNNSYVCLSVHNYANDNAVTSPTTASNPGALAALGEKLSTGGSDSACIIAGNPQVGTAAATGSFTWAQTNGTTYSQVWAIAPASAAPSQMSGTGGITASGAGVMRSMSRQSGTGSATVSGTGVQRSVSRMTGAGGISVSGTSAMRSMSRMGATGAITATGTGNMSGPPSEMSATGTIMVTGAGTMRSLSRMSAAGTIAVTGTGVQKSWSRQAGTGSITAAGVGAMQALSRMVGAGTVSVVGTGFMGQDGPPTSAMSGTGALTVSGTGTMRAESRMSAGGTITVVGGGVLLSLSRMTATGSISVTGTAAHSGDVPGTVVGAVARWGAVTGNVATSGGTTGASEAEGGVAGATEAVD